MEISIRLMIDISFVVTSHNSEKYIKKCLDSVVIQNESTLTSELIVVDDGSSDGTRELLSGYAEVAKFYFIENSGVEIASNIGIQKSNGRFVSRLDADDELLPDFLKEVSNFLEDSESFYYGNYYLINGESEIIKNITLPDFSAEEILCRGDFLATGTVYPKKILSMVNGYSEIKKNCGLENYELIIKLIMRGVKGIHISKTLFLYRTHSKNMSKIKKLEIIEYGKTMMCQFAGKKFTTNEFHPYGLDLDER